MQHSCWCNISVRLVVSLERLRMGEKFRSPQGVVWIAAVS